MILQLHPRSNYSIHIAYINIISTSESHKDCTLLSLVRHVCCYIQLHATRLLRLNTTMLKCNIGTDATVDYLTTTYY